VDTIIKVVGYGVVGKRVARRIAKVDTIIVVGYSVIKKRVIIRNKVKADASIVVG